MAAKDVSSFASSVALLGTISSQLMNLSSIPSIYEICMRKSTLSYPFFPFLISLVASVTGLTYAAISGQGVVIVSTILSMSQNMIYLSVHYKYSSQPESIIRLLIVLTLVEVGLLAIGPAVTCSAFSHTCKDFSVYWIGFICTFVYCIVYCGQLSTFREVIRTKSSNSISPWLTAGTLCCACIWTWYSLLVEDMFYLASSIIGDVSAVVQVYLLIRYPRQLAPSHELNPTELKLQVIGAGKEVPEDKDSEISTTAAQPLFSQNSNVI